MSLEIFEKHFYPEYNDLLKELDKLNSLTDRSGIDLIKEYDLISNRVKLIQNYFSDYTSCLSLYEQRKAQEHLNKLNQHAATTRTNVFPKKKFEFKSKKNLTKTTATGEKPIEETQAVETPDANVLSLHTCTISNLENETIVKDESEIANADIGIFNLKNCIVKLKGTPSVLHIKNIENTTILCGPLLGTAFIAEANNSKLNLACHQLRIHDSVGTDFYINVSSRTIIENCQRVRFAPYAWSYPNIEKHFSCGLNLNLNKICWRQIDDFNWLVGTQQSPNWSFVDETERLKWSDEE